MTESEPDGRRDHGRRPWTRERILAVCATVARRGEEFEVHRFRHGTMALRRMCEKLRGEGLLTRSRSGNPTLSYHRPEDVPVLEAARARHAVAMRLIHARNVEWHERLAEENPANREYHEREAERERGLAR